MLRLAGASVCLLAAFLHSLPLTASMDQRLPRFTIPHNSMVARHAVHPFDLLFSSRIEFAVCCNAVPEGGLPAKRLGAKQPTNFAEANNRFSLGKSTCCCSSHLISAYCLLACLSTTSKRSRMPWNAHIVAVVHWSAKSLHFRTECVLCNMAE
jgi:hypothetical protein